MEKTWVVLDTEVLASKSNGELKVFTKVFGPYQEADALDIADELNKDGQTTAWAVEISTDTDK